MSEAIPISSIPILRLRDAEGNVREVIAIRGEPGKSAYELAVEAGFEGTLEEWFAALTFVKPIVLTVNDVKPDEGGNIKIDIPSIVTGTAEVADGSPSPYPEGTLYVVIE